MKYILEFSIPVSMYSAIKTWKFADIVGQFLCCYLTIADKVQSLKSGVLRWHASYAIHIKFLSSVS